jgi:hypothetical protein
MHLPKPQAPRLVLVVAAATAAPVGLQIVRHG